MKLLYVTDLHGDDAKYEKIFDIAISNEIKVIINGGDILPKLGDRFKEQPTFINGYLKKYFDRLKKNNIKNLCSWKYPINTWKLIIWFLLENSTFSQIT